MTWYATEILARCTPALLAAVMKEPKLASRAYLIREPVHCTIDETRHSFHPPEGGLLVVRPICEPGTHCAEWHDADVLSWHALEAPERRRTLSPRSLGEHVEAEFADQFPPPAFFGYLKNLSIETGTDMAFFHRAMWGGDTDLEYVWLFGTREEASVLLQPAEALEAARVQKDGDVQTLNVDLLSDTLAYLGAPIASAFCVFHTRGFAWEAHRLVPARTRAPTKARSSGVATSPFLGIWIGNGDGATDVEVSVREVSGHLLVEAFRSDKKEAAVVTDIQLSATELVFQVRWTSSGRSAHCKLQLVSGDELRLTFTGHATLVRQVV
ncbi:MAG: hypothetical protein RLZZ618_760 [Pseudomonadota bacterium]|jgi:hypothetical protein